MKKFTKLIALFLAILSLCAVAMPAMAAVIGTGEYNTAAVNLRSSPGGSSYGLVSNGATCDILSYTTVSNVLWYQVKITSHTKNDPDLYGKTGWSMAQYITVKSGNVPGAGSGTNKRFSSAVDAFGSGYLSDGSVGNYVRNVQLCLSNEPYKFYVGSINGVFDQNTTTAVVLFQSSQGLKTDGIVGPATRNALWTYYEDLLQTDGYR